MSVYTLLSMPLGSGNKGNDNMQSFKIFLDPDHAPDHHWYLMASEFGYDTPLV